ncbi:molybdopterin-dependent oxidoreductase [Cryptosporangium phraense]|uniref:Molybdopterin-dependent oxidoreductase n=1 Tax=Cryptosporangium phraense TaxID=2593070 RepID=A0A545ARX5_9ACTN|nr:molybdopterin-dependent oxidoreductase [Cryptosporangium phraense]TQS44100.1 molybdopterin-dependent oxidoreductase [Cryptosporangium phraense]
MTRTERLGYGALIGVAAAGAALGVAEPVAALVGRGSSPVVAVGLAVIDAVPRPVKDFGIRTFGQHDKEALLAGVFVLLALFAVGVGVAALSRRWIGVGGVVVFGALGAVAALSRPAASVVSAVPSVLGTVAAVGVIVFLLRAVPRPAASAGVPAAAAGAARPAPRHRSRPRARLQDQPQDRASARDTPPVRRPGLDRRGFLAVTTSVVAASAALGGVGRFLTSLRDVGAERRGITLPAPADPAPALPAGADLKLPDLTPFLTPPRDFYRVDTALVVPQVSIDEYRLRIHGRVRHPLTLTYQDLLERDLIERVITLSCVSNEVGGDLAGTARWLGVRLKDLLDEAGPADDADQLLSTSVDGWTCGTPTAVVRDGRDAMLAVGMNGEPLPLQRGYPVRMLVPGLYGYVSATKWLVDLELTRFSDVAPYWVKRGWKREAPIKTFSRIDTPRPLANATAGRLAVAGVAWAQHRGVEKVEVRVDGGAWNAADLAAVPSVDTWRQWRWEWDADPGRHTLEVRATDRTGATQPEAREKPFPDGATGWHSVVVTVS